MDAEKTARTYFECFGRADLDGIEALYAPTTSYRQVMLPAALTTPAEIKSFESGMFALFSDITMELEWIVANGEQAAAGIVVEATHTTDMPTPDGSVIPARGIRIRHEASDYFRVDGDSRIVDHQRYQDIASMMSQLTAGL